MDDAGYMQVQCAAGSRDEAEALAGAVLEARLAACVQVIGPVTSRYWWQGGLESAEEWLLLVKTTAAAAGDVMAELGRRHSYDEPEITAVPLVAGSPGYLAWIDAEVGGAV